MHSVRFFSFRIRDFPVYVKGCQAEFLKEFQLQPRVKYGFPIMEVCPGAAAEGGAAVLIEDDYIDLFDVPVGEPPFLLPLRPHVLAHDQIR